jgi:glycosyltransferase involved in cell wall biosynthesis
MTASEPSTKRGVGCTKPTVSIVIPAFNEAARIGDSIRRIEKFLETFSFDTDVIVVDDGSMDETTRIIRELQFPRLRLISNTVNHGKGYAVKCGVLAATGDYVLFSDADLSAPIEELDKLLSVALEKDADVVVGSRAVDRRYIQKHQSSMREFGGIVFNVVVRLMLGLRIHDTQCGFKLFKRATATAVFRKQTTEGFGFDPELLFLAASSCLSVRRRRRCFANRLQRDSDSIRSFCFLPRRRGLR